MHVEDHRSEYISSDTPPYQYRIGERLQSVTTHWNYDNLRCKSRLKNFYRPSSQKGIGICAAV